MQTRSDLRSSRRLHRRPRLVALAAFALVARLPAQEPSPTPAEPAAARDEAYEAERQELLALKALYERAVKEENPLLLAPHLHPRFTAVMVTGDAVAGPGEVDDYWQRVQELMGAGGKYSFEASAGEKVSVFGDIAVAHGTTNDLVVTGAGKEFRFNGAWTAICKKEDGAWKLLRIHDSMSDPVTNEFVAAALSATRLVSAAVAGGAGLVLGLLAGVLLARRRQR